MAQVPFEIGDRVRFVDRKPDVEEGTVVSAVDARGAEVVWDGWSRPFWYPADQLRLVRRAIDVEEDEDEDPGTVLLWRGKP